MIKFSDKIIELFLKKLEKTIKEGEVITHTTIENSETKILDSEGEIMRTHKTHKKVTKVTKLPTPSYVFALYERSTSEDKAIEFLSNLGYVVSDPTIAAETQKNVGLSEKVVMDIRQKLLGIE